MTNLLNLYLESIKDVVIVFLPLVTYSVIVVISIAVIFRFTPQRIISRISERLQKLRMESNYDLVARGYVTLSWVGLVLVFVFSAFGREGLASKALTLLGVTVTAIILNAIVLYVTRWVIDKKD